LTDTIEDKDIVQRLWEHYEPALTELLVSQRTGAPVSMPADLNSKAQLLSFVLYDPHIALVWGDELAYSQLEIWRPYILASKRRIVTLSRALKREGPVPGLKRTPSYSFKAGFPISAGYAASSLSALIYITDKNENLGLMRAYPGLIHVCGHHGDSEKHSSFSRLPAAYDFLLVADAHSMMRYIRSDIHMATNRMIPIGNTVVADVEFTEERSEFSRLLYAPTFEGYSDSANFSSLKSGGASIAAWQDGTSRIALLRPHPGTGKRLPDYRTIATEFPKPAIASEIKGKAKQFNWSDFLVADISGVTSEYLFTGKPIVIPISESDGWKHDYVNGTNLKDYIYMWDYKKESLNHFVQAIKSDPLRDARLARRSSLYAGAKTFADSSALFEQALGYFIQAHRWHRLRQGAQADSAGNVPLRRRPLPKSAELSELVKNIIKGKVALKA
jgi:hypothetical protein